MTEEKYKSTLPSTITLRQCSEIGFPNPGCELEWDNARYGRNDEKIDGGFIRDNQPPSRGGRYGRDRDRDRDWDRDRERCAIKTMMSL